MKKYLVLAAFLLLSLYTLYSILSTHPALAQTLNNYLYLNGNVGIGKSNPAYPLDVTGDINFTGTLRQNGAAFSAGVPTGAVMFFNLTACPGGWTALTSAQGRYIVGLPLNGTLAGTDGTALSNLEDRPTGQHSHTVNDPGHTHKLTFADTGTTNSNKIQGTGNNSYGSIQSDPATTGITINLSAGTSGVVGTNAPYIQFLACQKQ